MPSKITLDIITHSNTKSYVTKDDGAVIVTVKQKFYKVAPGAIRN
jgi:beta-lactamase superfamily II metal-dependent hydrolase